MKRKKPAVYRDTILGTNFKSLIKSIVSNQQNSNQVVIYEIRRALRSLNVNKNNISSEPFKHKYKKCGAL